MISGLFHDVENSQNKGKPMSKKLCPNVSLILYALVKSMTLAITRHIPSALAMATIFHQILLMMFIWFWYQHILQQHMISFSAAFFRMISEKAFKKWSIKC